MHFQISSNKDLAKFPFNKKTTKTKLNQMISTLLSPIDQRSKSSLQPIIHLFQSQAPSLFPNNFYLSEEMSFQILQSLKLSQASQGKKLFFNHQGLLILISGIYQIEGKMFEINAMRKSELLELLIGKIGNNGFEFPVKNTMFLPPKEPLEVISIENGFWAFVPGEKILSTMNIILRKNKCEDLYILTRSAFFKEIPLKTLNFLNRKLFMEKAYTLGSFLPREGLYFIKSGGLELLKEHINDRKVSFSLAYLSKGETYGFFQGELIENLILRSVSNETRVSWISEEGLKVLGKYDPISLSKLKEQLLKKSKLRKGRYEDLLEKFQLWIENKENSSVENKEFSVKSQKESLFQIPSMKSMKEIQIKSQGDYNNPKIRMDSWLSIPSLKEIPEIKEKTGKMRKMKSLDNFKGKRIERKKILIRNLKTQLTFFPLSITNPNKATLERLALKILNKAS